MKTIEMVPTLAGKKLALRAFQPSDMSAALVHFNTSDVHKMLRTPVPFLEEHARKRMESPAAFVIDVGGFAGEIGFHSIIRGHRAEFYYSLSPIHWGKGVMQEAIALATAWAAKEFQLIRIQAYVFSYNPASARLLEKCGFLCEGRLRKDFIKSGYPIDRFIYSRIYP